MNCATFHRHSLSKVNKLLPPPTYQHTHTHTHVTGEKWIGPSADIVADPSPWQRELTTVCVCDPPLLLVHALSSVSRRMMGLKGFNSGGELGIMLMRRLTSAVHQPLHNAALTATSDLTYPCV